MKQKPSKLFDESIKKTCRRKKQYDPNQKYRRYKSKVEAKLYENLVKEPEQSIVEAIKEATEQIKAPGIKKIIKDANIDNKDLDSSEIIHLNDVIQPKNQEEKRHQLFDAIEKRNPELKQDRKKKAAEKIEGAFKKKIMDDNLFTELEKEHGIKIDKDQPFKSIMNEVRKYEGADEHHKTN